MSTDPHWLSAQQASPPAPVMPPDPALGASGYDMYGRPLDALGRPIVSPPPRRRKQARGPLGALAGLILLVLSKLKWLLILLKFSKIGVTTISMLLSVLVYGAIFGWVYGIGFVALIFVHEMGHVIAARLEGIKVSAPMFIPFMGAMIAMRERPKDSLAEAKIAAGGPILGSLGALACYELYGVFHLSLLLALAYIGFFLNLFNLVPVSPLDGGRILGAASKWALVVGLPLLALFAFKSFNPFLFYFLILGGFEVWHRFTRPDYGYYRASTAARWGVVACYALLAASVAWGMSEAHTALQAVRASQGML